jgi:RHS repeat-associated protein
MQAWSYSGEAVALPKTRVWGSKPKNVHCSSAIGPLKIELRWGCEESSREKASGSGVTFKYDPFGRRIEKISPTTTSIFVYNDDNLVETVNASGGEVASYAQGQDIDEPLAMDRNGTTYYYEADGLGSITSLSSSAGALANTYSYDSFGNLTNSTGSVTSFFRYTAREFDTETNLYYNRARYYDSTGGRFISEDRIGFYGGGNFYAYVHNDTTDSTDPSGLCGKCDNIPPHPPDASVDANMQATRQNGLLWWYNTATPNRGPWDYKWYNGTAHPNYDNFGNFNFGATGCAAGIPLNALLRGAGLAKSRDLKNDPYGNFWQYPYGNQPDKQGWIIKGFQFCKQCEVQNGGSYLPFWPIGPSY